MVKVSNRAMMLRNCICSNLYFYRTMSFYVYINVFLASVCTIILFSHNIVFFLNGFSLQSIQQLVRSYVISGKFATLLKLSRP